MPTDSRTPSGWTLRRFAKIALGVAVTAGCLFFALRMMAGEQEIGVVLRQIGAAFADADYRWLVPIWLCLFAFYYLKAQRWQSLLTPLGRFHTLRDVFGPMLIGFAFNNVLPARLGEFVRVFVFARRQRVSHVACLASVALERIFDVVALLTYLVIGLLLIPDASEDVRRTALVVFGVAAVGVFAVVAYLTWTAPFVRIVQRCLDMVPILPHTLRGKIVGILEAGAIGLASVKNGRMLGVILVNSMVQWGCSCAIVWFSLKAFAIDVSPAVAMVVMGVVAFGVAAPSVPGYFGVVQVCFLMVLQAFVENDETVFAASIFYHMSQYVPVTIAGLVIFNRMGLSMSEVERGAEREQTEVQELSEGELPHPRTRPESGSAPVPRERSTEEKLR